MIYCPFIRNNCLKESCGLWLGVCAFKRIAEKLEDKKIVTIKLDKRPVHSGASIRELNIKPHTYNCLTRQHLEGRFNFIESLFDESGKLREQELLKIRTFGSATMSDLKQALLKYQEENELINTQNTAIDTKPDKKGL